MERCRLIAHVVVLIALISAFRVLTPAPAVAQTGIISVDVDATGSGNGSSWANANPNLPTVLQTATSGAELWVAKGRYTPDPANVNIGDPYAGIPVIRSPPDRYCGAARC